MNKPALAKIDPHMGIRPPGGVEKNQIPRTKGLPGHRNSDNRLLFRSSWETKPKGVLHDMGYKA